MKAVLNSEGKLLIQSETTTEDYALSQWWANYVYYEDKPSTLGWVKVNHTAPEATHKKE